MDDDLPTVIAMPEGLESSPDAQAAPPDLPSPPEAEVVGLPGSDGTPLPSEAPTVTPEAIASYLEKADHDALAKIPAYNAQVSRAIQKTRADEARRRNEAAALGKWDTYFKAMSAEQLIAAREDDKVDELYRRVRDWRKGGSQSRVAQEVTATVLDNMRKFYRAHPTWGKVVDDAKWKEIASETDPAKFLTRLVDAGVDAARKDTEKETAEVVQAAVTAELAKHNLTQRAPAVPPGTQAGAAPGVMTRAQYMALTPEQHEKLLPRQIDALFEHWQTNGG